MQVELLLTSDCPNAATARAVLTECLDMLGLDVRVCERVGDHPSPTILIDGVDVTTNAQGAPPIPACRLQVPTSSQILSALGPGRQHHRPMSHDGRDWIHAAARRRGQHPGIDSVH